jgi:hypothetical protein
MTTKPIDYSDVLALIGTLKASLEFLDPTGLWQDDGWLSAHLTYPNHLEMDSYRELVQALYWEFASAIANRYPDFDFPPEWRGEPSKPEKGG